MADYNSTLPILGSVAIASSALVGVSGDIFTNGKMTGSMAMQGIGSVIIQSAPLIGVSGLVFTEGKIVGSFHPAGVGSVIIQSNARMGISGIVEVSNDVQVAGSIWSIPDIAVSATEREGIVQSYKTTASVSASAIGSHGFVSLGSLYVTKVLGGFSGKAKLMVLESGTSAVPLATGFNSTANPNIDLYFGESNGLYIGNGSRVILTMTNRDSAAQDIYSTIIGYHTHVA